jgi:hypothetical protein
LRDESGGIGKRRREDVNVDLVANEHHSTLPDISFFPTIPRAIEKMNHKQLFPFISTKT